MKKASGGERRRTVQYILLILSVYCHFFSILFCSMVYLAASLMLVFSLYLFIFFLYFFFCFFLFLENYMRKYFMNPFSLPFCLRGGFKKKVVLFLVNRLCLLVGARGIRMPWRMTRDADVITVCGSFMRIDSLQ